MDLRVLKYFLIASQEENITKAAKLLHLTQPTLSRQLMQLEDELGVTLFKRSRHHIILTEEGMLLKRRAQEIIDLADKAKNELSRSHGALEGTISIGSGELQSSDFLAGMISAFQKDNPFVKFSIYSGNSDNIKEKIENGLLDAGLLQEPVDLSKYSFIRIPVKERWGIVVRSDSPLAQKDNVTPADLSNTPLILPQRSSLVAELMNWFGSFAEGLKITGTGNLLYNLAILAKNNGSCVITLELNCKYDGMTFVPLSPVMENGTVLVWKKGSMLSEAVSAFIESSKKYVLGINNY